MARDQASKAYLNRYERLLIDLTRYEMRSHAEFVNESSFRVTSCPFTGDIPLGLYELPRRSGEAHLYRLNHPLAEAVLAKAKNRDLPTQEVRFDYGAHDGKITVLEPLLGKSGWLMLSNLTTESLGQAEDHLIFAATTDAGQHVDQDVFRRMFSLQAEVQPSSAFPTFVQEVESQLRTIREGRQATISRAISERNVQFFEAEAKKLDGWADDLKLGLEREIKELDRQIKEARRSAMTALTLDEKLENQKQVKALEGQRNQRRRSLFEAQDDVDDRRDQLIAHIEGQLTQKKTENELFVIRWSLV